MTIYLKRVPNPTGGCTNAETGERCYFVPPRCCVYRVPYCGINRIYRQVPAPVQDFQKRVDETVARLSETIRREIVDLCREVRDDG